MLPLICHIDNEQMHESLYSIRPVLDSRITTRNWNTLQSLRKETQKSEYLVKNGWLIAVEKGELQVIHY